MINREITVNWIKSEKKKSMFLDCDLLLLEIKPNKVLKPLEEKLN